jgi:hypothetical protein
MIATLFSILTSSALAAPVPEQPDAPPKGPPPLVMAVSVAPDGQVAIQRIVTEMVLEERTEKVRVGNQIVEQKVTVMVPVLRETRVALDSKDVQVLTADGKRVDPKDVRSLLKKTSPVLVSADGKPVDPFYLRLVKENALIVILPQAGTVPTPAPLPPDRVPDPTRR